MYNFVIKSQDSDLHLGLKYGTGSGTGKSLIEIRDADNFLPINLSLKKHTVSENGV
jgi:hypothetical protein